MAKKHCTDCDKIATNGSYCRTHAKQFPRVAFEPVSPARSERILPDFMPDDWSANLLHERFKVEDGLLFCDHPECSWVGGPYLKVGPHGYLIEHEPELSRAALDHWNAFHNRKDRNPKAVAKSQKERAAERERQGMSHGLYRYNAGCRCDLCREAKRLANGNYYRIKKSHEEGTTNAYRLGCRCEQCKELARLAYARQTLSRRVPVLLRGTYWDMKRAREQAGGSSDGGPVEDGGPS